MICADCKWKEQCRIWSLTEGGGLVRRRRKRKPSKKREHFLVPKHELMKEDEVEKLLKELGVDRDKLPKIKIYDPAIADLGAKEGDVIKIHREGSPYYRVVVM